MANSAESGILRRRQEEGFALSGRRGRRGIRGAQPPKDFRPAAKGERFKVIWSEGERPFTLRAGYLDRNAEYRIEEATDGEFALKSAEVKSASGHRFYAVTQHDPSSSYEHYGTGWVVPLRIQGGQPSRYTLLFDDTEDFSRWVGWFKENVDSSFEVYPYSYKYRDTHVRYDDHHVDERTGWTR